MRKHERSGHAGLTLEPPIKHASFARVEVVAPTGLWERGLEALPSGRLFQSSASDSANAFSLIPEKHRAPKAFATSPSGETRPLTHSVSQGNALSLDRHASRVSPRPLHVADNARQGLQPLDKIASKAVGKKQRHKLRRAAGKALPYERVANCGQKAVGGLVSLHHRGGNAHFSGIETCGSVWTCPVCAARITEGRRVDIDAVLKTHREAGGRAYMATLTIPHHRFSNCKMLRKGVTAAWRKVKSGKAWVTAREGYGWLGDIRALEVTHGKNGWHPHLHVLILFKPGKGKSDAYAFASWLYSAWARVIERLCFGICSKDAFTFDAVQADQGAAKYVSKWGAALELTKAHTKKARSGGRTPWQILADFAEARKSTDGKLFREYACSFKGARHLTWSRGLRALYLDEPELADNELADEAQPGETQTAALTRDLFKLIAAKGKTAHVLNAQERGSMPAVLETLTKIGIPWRLSKTPGLERGRMVPLITLGNSLGNTPFA